MYASAGYSSMASDFDHLTHTRDEHADSGERTYALFNHLIGLISVGSAGIPLAGLIGAIIMWRIKAKESPFLDDHGREAVNFQLSLLLYLVAGVALGSLFALITLGIGAIILPVGALALVALALIGQIRGAMAAHRGEYYRYPMCVRFIGEPAGERPLA